MNIYTKAGRLLAIVILFQFGNIAHAQLEGSIYEHKHENGRKIQFLDSGRFVSEGGIYANMATAKAGTWSISNNILKLRYDSIPFEERVFKYYGLMDKLLKPLDKSSPYRPLYKIDEK